MSGLLKGSIFLAAALLASSAWAKPKLSIANQTHDFGQVTEGTVVEAIFSIKNAGSSTLEITRIQPACGCTAAVVSSASVLPGETAQLKATFDTSGFFGSKNKSIRLFSNDPDKPTAVVSFQGTIAREVEVAPQRIDFGEILRGEEASEELALSAVKGVSIKEVVARSEFLKVEELGDSRRIRVTLLPTAPIGLFRGRVVIKSSSAKSPVLNVPVVARVRGVVAVRPADLSFGLVAAPLSKDLAQTVEIRNTASTPLDIVAVESDNSQIKAALSVVDKGRVFSLEVRVDAAAVGIIKGRVRLRTNIAGEEEISIPVYAIISRKGD